MTRPSMNNPNNINISEPNNSIRRAFPTMNDLIKYTTHLGAKNNIQMEIYNKPHAYMIVCSKYKELLCEAKVLGMYNSETKQFNIKKCELAHTCILKTPLEMAAYEVRKPRYANMRIGEVLENLIQRNIKLGYFDVYKLMKGGRNELPMKNTNGNDKENVVSSNTTVVQIPKSSRMSVSPFQPTNIPSVPKNNLGDNLFNDCLKYFEYEFKTQNPDIFTRVGKGEFFFKQSDYSKYLRNMVDLKIYQRPNGYLIMGFLFDPNNEPVVQSLLMSEHSKEEAIASFVKYSAEERCLNQENGVGREDDNAIEKEFFIVDLDVTLFEVLKANGIGFFIRTRSVCAYLEESIEDDPLSFQYFHDCNYGEREYLKIDSKYYLAKHCPKQLYGLNNMPVLDPDYINDVLLSQPFFNCLNSLIWLIKEDVDQKKTAAKDCFENTLPEALNEFLDEASNQKPFIDIDYPLCGENLSYAQVLNTLSSCACACGKYQEFTFPCIHVVKKLQKYGYDPYYFLSSIHSKNNILKLASLVPVVNVKPSVFAGVQKIKSVDMSFPLDLSHEIINK